MALQCTWNTKNRNKKQISSCSWLNIVFVLDIIDGAYILEIKDYQKLSGVVVVQVGGGRINSFGVLKVSGIIH